MGERREMREIKLRYRFENLETKEVITRIITITELEMMTWPTHFWLDWTLLSRDEYTGLHDRNSVEIYEGDKVSHLNIKMLATDGVVRFDWEGACIKVGETWNRLDMISREGARGFEVIGNIYENPELIKANT